MEYLEAEKGRLANEMKDPDSIFNSEQWTRLSHETNAVLKEINESIRKNMKLLSFSMDHIKGTVENILSFINNTAYLNNKMRISLFPSREI